MKDLTTAAETLAADWKWSALFEAPTGHEREYRAWLGEAIRAEQEAILRSWSHRRMLHGSGGAA